MALTATGRGPSDGNSPVHQRKGTRALRKPVARTQFNQSKEES